MGLSQASNNQYQWGFRATTSIYGSVIPIVLGTQRIPGNVIDVLNWTQYQITSGGKGGGKGAGGGKGGGNTGYKADVLIGLCFGPGASILNIWNDKTEMTIQFVSESTTIPSGSSPSYTPAQSASFYSDLGAAKIATYSVSTNDYGNPAGPGTISGTQHVPMVPVASSPGAGQYVPPSMPGGSYTFSAADAGTQIVIAYTFFQATNSSPGPPVANISLVFFNGATGQSPWSHLVGNSTHGIGYNQLAYAAFQQLDLGSSGNIPNLNFEYQSLDVRAAGCFYPPTSAGSQPIPVLDCNPRDVLIALLTTPSFGVQGWQSAWTPASVTNEFANYCYANSIFCSALLDSQKTAAEWFADFFSIGNGYPVWTDGYLKMRSYGDTTAVGNGVTFTPSTAPVYDLDDDDFIVSSIGSEPIDVGRPTIRDAYNISNLQFSDRSNSYNYQNAQAMNDLSIAENGPRPEPQNQLAHVTTQSVAAQFVDIDLRNNVYKRRNNITFDLPIWFALLEPGDMVTITIQEQGLVKFPVRLISITETEGYKLQCIAEEFPWGDAQPTIHPKQTVNGFLPGYFADPGLVNPPIFVEAVSEMVPSGFLLLIALSGGLNWGGGTVHVSRDGGNSYTSVGSQIGDCAMGELQTVLPAGSDPDTTDTITVNLLESDGSLEAFTQAEADNFQSLIQIDQEFIAFTTATLVSSNTYQLGGYLRRGVYGSTITPHAIGAPVVFIGTGPLYGNLFQFPYQKADIGKNLYFKITSFNQQGSQEQQLANVTPYEHTLDGGEDRPPFPWNPGPALTVTQSYATATAGLIAGGGTTIPSINADGSATPQMGLLAALPPNTFSTKIQAPVITQVVATANTTGQFTGKGQTLVVAMNSLDGTTSGAMGTDLSNYGFVTLPNDNSPYALTITCTFDPNASTIYSVFIGPQQDQLERYTGSTTGTSPTATSVVVGGVGGVTSGNPIGPPDAQFSSLQVQISWEAHGGFWGGEVASSVLAMGGGAFGPYVITMAGSPGFPTSGTGIQGRYLVQLASPQSTTSGIATTTVNAQLISANTANSVTVPNAITANSIVCIRLQATTYGQFTIGDSLLAGLTANAEVGYIVMIVEGTGAGQTNVVWANDTSGNYTFATAWDITPDATSAFIVIAPTITETPATAALTVAATNTLAKIPIGWSLPNIGATWFMRFLATNANGITALPGLSPWMDMWVYGSPGDITTGSTPIIGIQ